MGWLEWHPKYGVFHPGEDYNYSTGNKDHDLPILSPYKGAVVEVYKGRWHNGFGIFVVLWHEKYQKWTRYAHMNSTDLKVGQRIEGGQEIGRSGRTGTDWVHVHFEVWNRKLYELQINHYWKFRLYPKGWNKWKVIEHYDPPAEFLQKCYDDRFPEEEKKENPLDKIPSDWARDYWNIARNQGIARRDDPHKLVTKEELIVILGRLGVLKEAQKTPK